MRTELRIEFKPPTHAHIRISKPKGNKRPTVISSQKQLKTDWEAYLHWDAENKSSSVPSAVKPGNKTFRTEFAAERIKCRRRSGMQIGLGLVRFSEIGNGKFNCWRHISRLQNMVGESIFGPRNVNLSFQRNFPRSPPNSTHGSLSFEPTIGFVNWFLL